MNTTQQHLSIADIQDDILILKNGGGAMILEVAAVNFGLLSEREQVAIISSFAQMLNSLSFSIQIVIHSERLHTGAYLSSLDKVQSAQTNPLLARMIVEYKQFIQNIVKDMDVLDKRFYIVIPLFSLELGLTASKANLEQKVKTVLLPRRDQVIRQLGRIGIQSIQLQKKQLIEVFYDIYNGEALDKPAELPISPEDLAVRLKNTQPATSSAGLAATKTLPQNNQPPQIPAATVNPPVNQSVPPISPTITQGAKTHPFVVEELE